MHHIVLWKWNQLGFRHSYQAAFVNLVADMIRRHSYDFPLRIVCITDDARGIDTSRVDVYPLWSDFANVRNASGAGLPSCYRRLKLFDPATQASLDIAPGDRIVSLDLDTIIAGDLRPLLKKDNHFVGWAVRGVNHLRVFNGSMWMFTAGTLDFMWTKFNHERTPEICNRAGFMGSDQSWLSYNFARDPKAGSWSYPQMVSYPKDVRRRPILSRGVSVVSFHGKHKPWHDDVQNETPWVRTHWREGVTQQPAQVA